MVDLKELKKCLKENNLKIIDFLKKGNVVRFYLGKADLKEYYGDDWNDYPYEHNAETVYDRFISGYIDIAWNINYYVYEPADNTCNSNYCKDDFVERNAPVIIVKEKKDDNWDWSYKKFEELLIGGDAEQKIYFEDPLSSLIGKGTVIDFKNYAREFSVTCA